MTFDIDSDVATAMPAPDMAAAKREPVTQRHADYCAAHGHAIWTQDGHDIGRCPRCGEVTVQS